MQGIERARGAARDPGIQTGRLDGIKVRRQVPLDPHVADFLCAEALLVIEVDGGQHGGSERDERRTRILQCEGISGAAVLERRGAARVGFRLRDHHRLRARPGSATLSATRDARLLPLRSKAPEGADKGVTRSATN